MNAKTPRKPTAIIFSFCIEFLFSASWRLGVHHFLIRATVHAGRVLSSANG
jgi:hypothetical protein